MTPESPNPPRRGIRRGIYIIPSMFTLGNIFCGFYAVMSAVKGYQQLSSAEIAAPFFDDAARAIGIAFLLDGLDGRIARMTKATSDFGVELDSIADVLTFGIAPAILAGFLLAFTFSFDDFIIAFFVAGSETTLPIYIFSSIRRGVTPEINAISTVIILASLALLFTSRYLQNRRAPGSQ